MFFFLRFVATVGGEATRFVGCCPGFGGPPVSPILPHSFRPLPFPFFWLTGNLSHSFFRFFYCCCCCCVSMFKAFAPFAPGPSSSSPKAKSLFTLPLQKLVYLVCNVLTLALGLWKCRSMGLLPTGTGDWLAFESRGSAPEISLF